MNLKRVLHWAHSFCRISYTNLGLRCLLALGHGVHIEVVTVINLVLQLIIQYLAKNSKHRETPAPPKNKKRILKTPTTVGPEFPTDVFSRILCDNIPGWIYYCGWWLVAATGDTGFIRPSLRDPYLTQPSIARWFRRQLSELGFSKWRLFFCAIWKDVFQHFWCRNYGLGLIFPKDILKRH